MKKVTLNLLWSMVVTVVTAVGASLTIKADIGTGTVNALSGSISSVSNIKIGTVLMFLNTLFVLVQLVVQKREFHWRQWLQIVTALVLGEVVNIMVYQVMDGWVVENYMIRLMLLIVGVCISCFGIGMIVRLNLVVFPIEAAATVVANAKSLNFRQVRQAIDFIALSLALIITFVFNVPLTVREGTIINFFIFSHIAQFFIRFVEKRQWFEKIRIS